MSLSKMKTLPIELLKERERALELKRIDGKNDFKSLSDSLTKGHSAKANRMIKDRLVEISERCLEISGELVNLSFIIERKTSTSSK